MRVKIGNISFLWIIFSIFLCKGEVIKAQKSTESKDSMEKVESLHEVVVESVSKKDIKDGIAFYPTKREKKFATNGISLLAEMALLELPYNPSLNTVTTSSGQAPNYFIDEQPATNKELRALNPSDVERVEYLPNPTMGVFMGKQNVVNFVMKKYKTGGYTKGSVSQRLDGKGGKYYLITRIACKNSYLDGYVDGNYTLFRNFGSLSENIFKDFEYLGVRYEKLTKTIDQQGKNSNNYRLSAYLKYNWSYRKITLTATGGWNWKKMQVMNSPSFTTFTPEIINSAFYNSSSSNLGIGPYLNLRLSINLPKEQQLSLIVNTQYASSKFNYIYAPDNFEAINNNNRDKSWSFFSMASYSKSFNSKNNITVQGYLLNNWNDTKYFETNDITSRFSSLTGEMQASYSHVFSLGRSVGLGMGGVVQHQKVDGRGKYYLTPECNVNFRYKWNKISSLEASSYIKSYGYLGNTRNNVVLRQTELTWKKGNPNLKDRLWWQSSITNIWTFNKSFSISAMGVYTAVFNQDNPVWEVIEGYDGLVETLDGNSKRHSLIIQLGATLKLFNQRLILTGNGSINHERLTGEYHRNVTFFKGALSARWYAGKWSFGASMIPRYVDYFAGSVEKTTYPWFYQCYVAFAKKNLNLQLQLRNPGRCRWDKKVFVETPHFLKNTISESSANRNLVTLTAVYSISYGKKVSRPGISQTTMLTSGALEL